MSRSGYTYDFDDNWSHIRYRGAVKSAIRGWRGQSFLKDIVTALDALPKKELIADSLESATGQYCTLGAVANFRGMDVTSVDPHDATTVAGKFGIANCMAREIVYENDEAIWGRETPESRFKRMRNWAFSQIKS